MKRTYIAIVGEFPPEILQTSLIKQISNEEPEAEMNFFDLPRPDCKDSVELISDNLLVHHYNQPHKDDQPSSRLNELIRDMIALGAVRYYILPPKTMEYKSLVHSIERTLMVYGVKVQKM